MGSAHIVNRYIFNKIGGYDERLGVGSKNFAAEETELFIRSVHHNYKCVYLKNLMVFHPKESFNLSKQCKYSFGLGACHKILSKKFNKSIFYYFNTLLKPIIGNFIYCIIFFPNKEKRRIHSKVFMNLIMGYLRPNE